MKIEIIQLEGAPQRPGPRPNHPPLYVLPYSQSKKKMRVHDATLDQFRPSVSHSRFGVLISGFVSYYIIIVLLLKKKK